MIVENILIYIRFEFFIGNKNVVERLWKIVFVRE